MGRWAWGTTYGSTNVGALIGGSTTSTPTALNNSDQVVGYYYTTASNGKTSIPFVYTPGTGGTVGTVVNVPGNYTAFTSKATGINDAGLVVGYNSSSAGAMDSFIYNANTQAFTVVPAGSNYSVQLTGVNASGIASGGLQATSYPTAISYNTVTNTTTDVGTPFSGPPGSYGTARNYAYAINNSGQIAGWGVNANAGGSTSVPFIATPVAGGGYTYLDLSAAITASDPNFAGTTPGGYTLAIDAQGNVAGSYYGGAIRPYGNSGGAFIYNKQSGTAVTLVDSSTTNVTYALNGLADVNGVPVAVGTQGADFTPGTTAIEYVNGNIVSLANAVPGYTITSASAVNGNGDVVVIGTPTAGGNATAFLLQATLDTWNNAGGTGDGATWDTTQQNWHNNSSGVATFSSANADNVLFSDANNGHYAVTLNSTVTPFAITFNNSAGNYVVSGTGTIGGGGGFVKTGTGSVTLNVASTYTGPTAVNQGKLTVNGSTAAVSAVTVASGATLSGTGTVAGTVAVAGTITGGSGATTSDTAGKLTTGAEAWNTGGSYVAKVTTLGTLAPTGNVNDTLVMSGLTVSSGFTVSLLATSGQSPKFTVGNAMLTSTPLPGSYVVLASDSESPGSNPFVSLATLQSLNLTLVDTGVLTAGGVGSVQLATIADTSGTGYDLIAEDVLAAAPEPTSLTLLAAAAPSLLARRRRRQAGRYHD